MNEVRKNESELPKTVGAARHKEKTPTEEYKIIIR